MANDDVKQRILGWCSGDDTLQLVEERDDPGADFLLALRSDGVDVGVGLVTGSDRVVARNVAELPDKVLAWRGTTAEGGQERSFEETLDRLPDKYTRPIYAQKCDAVYQHVFDSYWDDGHSVYDHAA